MTLKATAASAFTIALSLDSPARSHPGTHFMLSPFWQHALLWKPCRMTDPAERCFSDCWIPRALIDETARHTHLSYWQSDHT